MLSSAVNRARTARSNDKGFTLIELLIVIIILGVLAGIVVFSVRGIADRGDKAACKANIATLSVAVEAYYAKKGVYPTSDDDITGANLAADKFVNPPVPAGIITWDGSATVPPTIKLVTAC